MSNHKLFCSIVLFLAAMSGIAQSEDQVMSRDLAKEAAAEYRRTLDISAIEEIILRLERASGEAAERLSNETVLQASAEVVAALYGAAELDFDFQKKPLLNSAVPGGGYRAGTDPQSISDPQVRAEYEIALNRDRRYAEKYRQQLEIRKAMNRMASLLRLRFSSSTPLEIRDFLLTEGMNQSFGDDFLERLEMEKP